MGSRARFILITFFLVIAASPSVGFIETGCFDGLRTAVADYRGAMQIDEEKIKNSSRENLVGVVETQQFELETHRCHTGPGMAYRIFGDALCKKPESDGKVKVLYNFELYYRKASTLDGLYKLEWSPGSSGLFQVIFEAEGNRWIPISKKEVLDLSGKGGKGPH